MLVLVFLTGHYNDAWGYWTTDGLGLLEYFVLCERLGSAPQMSIFTGYVMYGRYKNTTLGWVTQDALDALEFANGDVSTRYGGIRAAMGHPGPFGMTRIEVRHLPDTWPCFSGGFFC